MLLNPVFAATLLPGRGSTTLLDAAFAGTLELDAAFADFAAFLAAFAAFSSRNLFFFVIFSAIADTSCGDGSICTDWCARQRRVARPAATHNHLNTSASANKGQTYRTWKSNGRDSGRWIAHKISTQDRTHADTKAHTKAHTSTDQPTNPTSQPHTAARIARTRTHASHEPPTPPVTHTLSLP